MLVFSININLYKFQDENMTPIIYYIGSPSLKNTVRKIFPQITTLPTLPSLIHRISKKYPHMIFLEDRDPDTSIQQTSSIRNQYPEAPIPVVIMGTQQWLPHQKNSLSILNHAYRIASSLPHHKIQDQVELLLDMSYFDRAEEECHPHALALLIGAFREEKNGFLYNPNRSIPLRDGGIITLDADKQLELFLHEQEPQFEQRENNGLGDWLLVMDVVWDKIQKTTNPGFLTQRKNLCLSVHTKYSRLFSLPLSSTALTFLFETDPEKTIQQRLKEISTPQSSIELEIEILYKMGFCRFQSARKSHKEVPITHHKILSNEEEGWNKLPLLKPEENLVIERASTLFFRTLLEGQQKQQNKLQDIWSLIKAGCYIQAHQKLAAIPSPSWIHLQLICWSQININTAQEKSIRRLLWLHQQHPTEASSVFLCSIFSEKHDFLAAFEYLSTAIELSQTHQKYQKIKERLRKNTPISRSLAQNTISPVLPELH